MGGVVGGIIGVGATMKSMQAQEKAAKAQLKAMQEQQRLQKMADARERRRMLREQAIQLGKVVNVSAQIGGGQGVTMGSSILTGLSGLQNQTLSGLGFQQTAQSSALLQQRFLNKAANYQMDASKWAGIGSAAMSLGSALPWQLKGF